MIDNLLDVMKCTLTDFIITTNSNHTWIHHGGTAESKNKEKIFKTEPQMAQRNDNYSNSKLLNISDRFKKWQNDLNLRENKCSSRISTFAQLKK